MSLQAFHEHTNQAVVQARSVLQAYDTVLHIMSSSCSGKPLRAQLYSITNTCKGREELAILDSVGLFFSLTILASKSVFDQDLASIAGAVCTILDNSCTRNKSIASCKKAGLHLVLAKKLHYSQFDEHGTDVVFNLLAMLLKSNSTGQIADACHALGSTRGLVAHFACTLNRLQLARQCFKSISSVRYVMRDRVRLNHIVGHLQREVLVGGCGELRHAAVTVLCRLFNTDLRAILGVFDVQAFASKLFLQCDQSSQRIGAVQILRSMAGYTSTDFYPIQAKYRMLPTEQQLLDNGAHFVRMNTTFFDMEYLAQILVSQQCQQLHANAHWMLRAFAQHKVFRHETACAMYRALLASLAVLIKAQNMTAAFDALQTLSVLLLNTQANISSTVNTQRIQLRGYIEELYNAASIKFSAKFMTSAFLSVYTTSFGSESACPICLEMPTDSASEIVMTGCGHRLHKTCLQKWRLKNQSCPICRSHGGTMISLLLSEEDMRAWTAPKHKRFNDDD